MEKAIIVRNLYKNFYFFKKDFHILQWLFTKKGYEKERKVLKDISFEVGKGEIVGLIGINGAGKSTLMKLIAGITYPSSGNIKVNGKVGSLINLSAGFHPDYTGRKNIYYKGTVMGMSKSEIDNIIDDIYDFVDLGEYFEQPLRMYSSGMSARLGFALAVYSRPEVLIIDEVLAVGDKSFQKKSRQKVVEMFQEGKSVIFSSHSDDLIRKFCSRVIYLKNGRIVFDGDVTDAQLSKIPKRTRDNLGNILSLPGGKRPEEVIYDYLLSLGADHDFWTGGAQRVGFTWDYFNEHGPLSEDYRQQKDREKYKKWFLDHQQYFETTNLMDYWMRDNLDLVSSFKTEFKTAHNHIAKRMMTFTIEE